MKVKDLIEKLKTFDPKLDVTLEFEGGRDGPAHISPITKLSLETKELASLGDSDIFKIKERTYIKITYRI